MSRRLIDVPDGIDVRHATEPEHITNDLQAMATDHTENSTEPKDPVGAVLDIVSCKSESRYLGQD